MLRESRHVGTIELLLEEGSKLWTGLLNLAGLVSSSQLAAVPPRGTHKRSSSGSVNFAVATLLLPERSSVGTVKRRTCSRSTKG